MIIGGLDIARKADGVERLVFLNPGACGATIWRSVAAAFAADYEIVTIDYPGFGDAPPQELQSIAHLSETVSSALCTLAPKPTHVVGFSMGSWIAQRLAAENTHDLKSLTLIGTSPHMLAHGAAIGEDWLRLIAEAPLEMILAQLASYTFCPLTYEQNPAVARVYARSCMRDLTSAEVLANQIRICVAYRAGIDPRRIIVPTLIVRGELDAFYPAAIVKRFCRTIPKGRYRELAHTGHACVSEDPASVMLMLREHLDAVRQSPPGPPPARNVHDHPARWRRRTKAGPNAKV